MKTIEKCWGAVGTGLFWLLWPVFVIYFRYSGPRVRVLAVCDDDVLLVQGWLSTKKWNLPGGGTHRNEKSVAAAVRELKEEVGISIPESSLTKLMSYKHTKNKFIYRSNLFIVNLKQKPELKTQKSEIWKVKWIPLKDTALQNLNDEAIAAIRRYKPLHQPSLL